MKAKFGWTVIVRNKRRGFGQEVVVYKRDCPIDEQHMNLDLANCTFATRKEAIEEKNRLFFCLDCLKKTQF